MTFPEQKRLQPFMAPDPKGGRRRENPQETETERQKSLAREFYSTVLKLDLKTLDNTSKPEEAHQHIKTFLSALFESATITFYPPKDRNLTDYTRTLTANILRLQALQLLYVHGRTPADTATELAKISPNKMDTETVRVLRQEGITLIQSVLKGESPVGILEGDSVEPIRETAMELLPEGNSGRGDIANAQIVRESMKQFDYSLEDLDIDILPIDAKIKTALKRNFPHTPVYVADVMPLVKEWEQGKSVRHLGKTTYRELTFVLDRIRQLQADGKFLK